MATRSEPATGLDEAELVRRDPLDGSSDEER